MSIFMNYPKKHSIFGGQTLFADIVNHCENYQTYMEPGSKITSAHECTHGCNSDIRNATKGRVNGFYVGGDRAIVVPEPNCKKSSCIPFISASLRSARYDMYVVGAQSWEDSPLYIFDEWTAYVNGYWAGITLKRLEGYTESGRVMDGPIEFNAYGVAVLMSAKSAEGTLNDVLRNYGFWLLRHSYNSYFEGLKDFEKFDVQDRLYEIQLNGSEWSAQRSFLKSELNFEIPTGVVLESDDPPAPSGPFIPWII